MKRLLLGLMLCYAVGCGSLHADYVEKDRATYESLQRCITLGIAAVGSETLEGRAYSLVNRSWDGRVAAAEAKIAAAAKEASDE